MPPLSAMFLGPLLFFLIIIIIIFIIATLSIKSNNMSQQGPIRTIYLYVVSIIGLMMIIIPTVYLINLGLRAWVFTKADEAVDPWQQPPSPYLTGEAQGRALLDCSEKCELSDSDKENIRTWLVDYQEWKEKSKDKSAKRQKEAVTALSFLIVGIPLFGYHWRLVRKEREISNVPKESI